MDIIYIYISSSSIIITIIIITTIIINIIIIIYGEWNIKPWFFSNYYMGIS